MHALLDTALHEIQDPRRVLLTRALGFESTVERREALVLGGAASPRFLRAEPSDPVESIPYTLRLSTPRILLTPRLQGELGEWVQFLEDLVQDHEPLLVVSAGRPDETLLRTFILNHEREVLRVGVCGFEGDLDALQARITASLGSARDHFFCEGAPDPHVRIALPIVEAAYLRWRATILIPSTGQAWSGLEAIAHVHVGGRDADEQDALLLELASELRDAETAL